MTSLEVAVPEAVATCQNLNRAVLAMTRDLRAFESAMAALAGIDAEPPDAVATVELLRLCDTLESIGDAGSALLLRARWAQVALASAILPVLRVAQLKPPQEHLLATAEAAMQALGRLSRSLDYAERQTVACLAGLAKAAGVRPASAPSLSSIRAMLRRVADGGSS